MLGLGLSISIASVAAGLYRGAANLFVTNYTQYVVSNNAGVVEGTSCLSRDMFELGIRTMPDYINFIFERWSDDGATIEGQVCFSSAVYKLNS
jgi:hypothetical protein